MREPIRSERDSCRNAAAEAIFLDNLTAIENIAAYTARRYRLDTDEREEFIAEVNLALVSDDYKALREFEGRSKLETYLFTIIGRIYWEWRHRVRGRWRPSSKAKSLGEVAVQLEELIHRDGLLLSEAAQILRDRHGIAPGKTERLMAALPNRIRHQTVAGVEDDTLTSQTVPPDQALENRERERLGHRVRRAVADALAQRSAEDRLILELSFRDGIKTVDIAHSLGIPVKKLYKRIDRILARLHKALVRAGFGNEDREELFAAIRLATLAGERAEPGAEEAT